MKTHEWLRIFLIAATIFCSLGLPTQQVAAQSSSQPTATDILKYLEENDIKPEEGYGSFTIPSDNIKVEEPWGLFTVSSFPLDVQPGEQGIPKHFLVLVHKTNDWQYYVQRSAEYQQFVAAMANAPEWILWLKTLQQTQNTVQTAQVNTFSLPALPYSYGAAWRLNVGQTVAHRPDNSIDFGTFPRGQAGDVHAMDKGFFVSKNDTCLEFQNPDTGLTLFYQHLDPATTTRWKQGTSVSVGTLIGRTIVHSNMRCDGWSTGHHVHVNVLRDGIALNFDRSSINGWVINDDPTVVNDATFSKGAVVATEHSDVSTLNNRMGSSDPDCPIDMLTGVILYKDITCNGTAKTFTSPTEGSYLMQFGMEASVYSIAVAPGWHVSLYDVDPGQGGKTCFYGSITDLRNYVYPGTNTRIGGSASSIALYDSGICPENEAPPLYSPLSCPAVQAADANTTLDDCNETDTTPPTATGFTVSLSDNIATLSAEGISDTGGSGVKTVQFTAKWNDEWHVLRRMSSAPYSMNWNMCSDNVPDGTIEFGLEVWDAGNNNFLWSEHFINPTRNKSYNCNPNQGGTDGAVKLHADTYYNGAVIWSQDTGFSNEPNAEGYSLTIPQGWSVKVWDDDGRRGSEKCFYESIHNLQDYGWQSRIQSLEVFSSIVCEVPQAGDTVNLCGTAGCHVFVPGYYELDAWDLDDTYEFVDQVPDGMSVLLIKDNDGKGTVECYNKRRDPLPTGGSADLFRQVTDLYVSNSRNCPVNEHQLIILYDGRNLDGWAWSAGTGPGRMNMRDLGPAQYYNDTLESIEIPNGKSVILYDDENQQGNNSGCLTGTHNELVSRDNRVSSIEIFDNPNCRTTAPTSFYPNGSGMEDLWLGWTHPDIEEVSFRIYKWNGADFTLIEETPKGQNWYHEVDLVCDTTHFYKLSAVANGRESVQVGWVQNSTRTCPVPEDPWLEGEVRQIINEYGTVTLKWYSNFADEYQASLYHADYTLTTGWQEDNIWTVRNLSPGRHNVFLEVRNRSHHEFSIGPVVDVQLAAPVITTATSPTCESIEVQWTDFSSYEDEFLVYRDGTLLASLPSSNSGYSETYTDIDLDEGSTHTYQVIASIRGVERLNGLDEYRGESAEFSAQVINCPSAPAVPNLLSPTEGTVFERGDDILFKWQGNAERYVLVLEPKEEGDVESYKYETVYPSFTLTDDLPANGYYWFVYAYNGELRTKSTDELEITIIPKQVQPSNQIFLPLVQR